MVCLAGDAVLVSLCGQTGPLDGSSRGRARAQRGLARSSQPPQSHLQPPSWLDPVPDDCGLGAGGGGSASTPEVATVFFGLQGGLTSSSPPISATVVLHVVSSPAGPQLPF